MSRPIINNGSSSSNSNRIITMHLVYHKIYNTISSSDWMRVLLVLVVETIANMTVLFLHSHSCITLPILISGIKLFIHNSILILIIIIIFNMNNINSIIVLLQLLPLLHFFLVHLLLLLLLLLLLPQLQPIKW